MENKHLVQHVQDLDIMKLAAQFVARNGSEFLTGLRSREETKREFFFLKDNHSLHTTFRRLTDAYSAVLLDSKEALLQLREDATDSAAVLQRYAPKLVACFASRGHDLNLQQTYGHYHRQAQNKQFLYLKHEDR